MTSDSRTTPTEGTRNPLPPALPCYLGLAGYFFYAYIFFNRLFFVAGDGFHFHPVFVQGGLALAALAFLVAPAMINRWQNRAHTPERPSPQQHTEPQDRPAHAVGRLCGLVLSLFAAALVVDSVGFSAFETNSVLHLTLQVIACVLFGAASVLYTLLWMKLYERIPFSLMMGALSTSFVLSVAVRSLTFFDTRGSILWDLVFMLVIGASLGMWAIAVRREHTEMPQFALLETNRPLDRPFLSAVKAPLAAILAVGFGTGLTWGQASSLGFSPLWASISAVIIAALCIVFGKRGASSQKLRSAFFASVFPIATLMLLATLLWDNIATASSNNGLFQLLYYGGLSLFEICILASLIAASQNNNVSCTNAILVKIVIYGAAFLAGKLCTLFLGDASMTFLLAGVLLVYLAFNIVTLAVNQMAEAAGSAPSVGDVITRNAVQAYGLTPREQEVLSCLLEGRSYEGIGRVLFISSSTVKTHVRHIYEKLSVASRDELIDKLAR